MDQRFWSSRILDLEPYVPGEQPKDRVFIKLNTNENPYPPAPGVLAAIRENTDGRLRMYPDPECEDLRAAIGRYHGVAPEQVFCGNGSDEVLGLSFYALFSPGQPVRFPDITYSFYPVYAKLFGIDYEEIPLREDFTIPVEEFFHAKGGAVVCNPNAPTGRPLPLEDIRSILDANRHVPVIVDEAYVDYGVQTALPLLEEFPNLLVIHTLSKARSLAGMRVGYAIGQPSLIAALGRVKNSFNSYPVDRLAQVAAIASFSDEEYFIAMRNKLMATRDRTTAQLRQLGFSVHQSCTNFVFACHPQRPAAEIQQALRDGGVLVRRFNRPRISEHLRISIGTDEEMETMLRLLEEYLKGN